MIEENKDLQEAESLLTKLLVKIRDKFKNAVNSTRIPKTVDVVFKYPDNFKAALDEAPPASQNWLRLGLAKTWVYFVILAFIIAIYLGKDALIFLINNIAALIALIPLGILAWWLLRKIRKS